MFKEKDGEDLMTELGLANERANELTDIVQNIMDKEAPDGKYGRTSHVLLTIAGRKDLNDVEKAVCVFIFSCKILEKGSESRKWIKGSKHDDHMPHISIPMPMRMPGSDKLKMQEFIDIEGRSSGMMIAPEGVGPEEMSGVIMALLVSILRQMPKNDVQEFCRNASLSFARIAMTGDVKL